MIINNPKKDLISILNNKKIKNTPETILINTPVVEVMKKTNIFWPEAHKDPKKMAKLAIASNEANGFNVINVPFDMAVESEALGCSTIWDDYITSTPQVKGIAFEDLNDIYIPDNFLNLGRFNVVLEAIDIIKKTYINEVVIIPFVDGPFTIAGHCIGINKLFKLLIKDMERSKRLLEKFNNICIKYANKQIEKGADAVMLLDPVVSGLSGKLFQDFIIPIYKDFNKKVRKKPILHICGNINRILEYIPKSDFKALSFDNPAMDICKVKKIIGHKMKIVGAVPTIDCLLEGNKNDNFNKTIDCLSKGVDIISPSCCIPPDTKLENLIEIKKAVKQWNIR
jgi:MtaA/CmuA family methyltransferase